MKHPTFQRERKLGEEGYTVIGVDEVGCGCLAGPVIAAAVHLPFSVRISAIHDSKLLSARRREEIFQTFLEKNVPFGVGLATVREVDEWNVRRASLLAMERAVHACAAVFQKAEKIFVLVDAWHIPNLPWPQQGIIHGDRLVKSIAAASIIAKVIRDRLMKEYDGDFPGYALAQHKGYGTELHRVRLQKLGASPLHRRSFLKKLGESSSMKG